MNLDWHWLLLLFLIGGVIGLIVNLPDRTDTQPDEPEPRRPE